MSTCYGSARSVTCRAGRHFSALRCCRATQLWEPKTGELEPLEIGTEDGSGSVSWAEFWETIQGGAVFFSAKFWVIRRWCENLPVIHMNHMLGGATQVAQTLPSAMPLRPLDPGQGHLLVSSAASPKKDIKGARLGATAPVRCPALHGSLPCLPRVSMWFTKVQTQPVAIQAGGLDQTIHPQVLDLEEFLVEFYWNTKKTATFLEMAQLFPL